MTFERFKVIADHVRYKPGWKIRVTRTNRALATVHVEAHVQSVYAPYHWITTNFDQHFKPAAYKTARQVMGCVKAVLFEAEDHEFAEAFRFHGRRLYDPHA